jgi:hypothetical protein
MDAPLSFSHFYDTNEQGYIPFYHGAESQPVTHFLSVPVKRNVLQPSPNQVDLAKKRNSIFYKAFFLKPIDEQTEKMLLWSQYVDFKGSLMATIDPFPPAAEESGWKIPEARHQSWPNDSQWAAVNQLRIHAGAPERSDEGIEKLLQ